MQTATARTRAITIPSSDLAFAKFVETTVAQSGPALPAEIQARLRRLFPRVVVRERTLSGEAPIWYVYRDGGWRPSSLGPWWSEPDLPRVEVSQDGWVSDANPAAIGLLGLDEDDPTSHHFTDFLAAGSTEDANALFSAVRAGGGLDATLLVRPLSGDVLAVELHAERQEDGIVGYFRLADDIDVPALGERARGPDRIVYAPATDVAFRVYAARALRRMPEPTPDGLALRLRRLYPHAQVRVGQGGWQVTRDREGEAASSSEWWRRKSVAMVRYDAEALILEANEAATSLLGRSLVGHHWQEFVTPGSTEQVTEMLEILAEVGAAESRFRMPKSDGSLIEFDSYTRIDGDGFTTFLRPVG